MSYIDDSAGANQSTFYVGGGGKRIYKPDGATEDYYSKTCLQRLTDGSGNLTAFQLLYPSGAKDTYGFLETGVMFTNAFLSEQIDAFGNTNRFQYAMISTNIVRLLRAIDAQGLTTTVSY